MIFEMKTTQQSGFPKVASGKPRIFVDRVHEYPCFSVNEIYYNLFIGTKAADDSNIESALILFPGNPHVKKEKKELLAFLLPAAVFEKIDHTGSKDYHYREFFLKSTTSNKITKILYDLFSSSERDSERKFLVDIQNHFAQILRHAEYRQPQLKDYLCSLVDDCIAPVAVSRKANEAFHSLVETGEHNAISKAIANVFISSMLGLYPMKYDVDPIHERKRDYVYVRTYLLNKMGMEFIWTPETISDSYVKLQDAVYSYECHQYEDAFKKAHSWLVECGNTVSDQESASAYLILGACLYRHADKCNQSDISNDIQKKLRDYLHSEQPVNTNRVSKSKNSEIEKHILGIACLKKCIFLNENASEALFLLYQYYKSRGEVDASNDYLRKSFEQSYAEAVIEVASRYVKKQESLACITGEVLFDRLSDIISNGSSHSNITVSECLYLRGYIQSKLADHEVKAQADFEKAAQMGHERAKQEISRSKRIEHQLFPSASNNPKAPCCFANSLNGNNLSFISTLPDREWSLFTTEQHIPSGIEAISVIEIDDFIKEHRLDSDDFQNQKIVFLFMSTDENRNINECLILLDKLFNIALNLPEKQRFSLIDQIEIFVGAKYEIASMLIDANLNDMGNDIYFKVHIADEARDSAHQLLCDAPLFIPFLDKSKHEDSANVVLFGCSEANYRLIKESIGCAYLGITYPVNITMLGTEADRMEKRLRQECPGLFHEPRVDCIRPKFVPCHIKEEDFPSLIYGSEFSDHPDRELVKVLSLGNYFVVDLSNDYDSIVFASELRTWLLRSRGTFDRTPFIGVKCQNSQNSYLASHLALSGQSSGNTYYSRYDLFPFGISREMYSYQRLIEDPRLEEVALKIHKSYYGGNNRQAENDYYSFTYNADSSLLTAIGLSYRLFAGGAFFAHKENYINNGALNTPGLLSDYAEAIKSKDEMAAALEQSRWNGFMLSRGWESANAVQVRAYKNQSTGSSHKHVLAKLHPFIREWDDLDSDDLKEIMGMLREKFDYSKLPKSTTLKSLKDMPTFFGKSIKDGKSR